MIIISPKLAELNDLAGGLILVINLSLEKNIVKLGNAARDNSISLALFKNLLGGSQVHRQAVLLCFFFLSIILIDGRGIGFLTRLFLVRESFLRMTGFRAFIKENYTTRPQPVKNYFL